MEKMLIDIYQSKKNRGKFIAFKHGTEISEIKLPDNFDQDLSEIIPYKHGISLNEDEPRIALDPTKVINDINSKGYSPLGKTGT